MAVHLKAHHHSLLINPGSDAARVCLRERPRAMLADTARHGTIPSHVASAAVRYCCLESTCEAPVTASHRPDAFLGQSRRPGKSGARKRAVPICVRTCERKSRPRQPRVAHQVRSFALACRSDFCPSFCFHCPFWALMWEMKMKMPTCESPQAWGSDPAKLFLLRSIQPFPPPKPVAAI